MNSTPEHNDDKLDRLLNETLNKLPERQAPETLLSNVMARIAEQEASARLSWFARLRWPVVAVSSTFVFLVSYYGQAIFAMLINRFNTGQFAGEIENVNAGIQLLSTLGNACAKVIAMVSSPLLFGVIAALLVVSAFSCAGVGTVLYRLAWSSHPITNR